ncbi:hypothetical protein [Jannaschia sp. R86511]|uniref:hypothetical protein n=1 Tax=Jannaschia sp. R86511 TaxID=3093853 RepID=UPI0036D2F5C1
MPETAEEALRRRLDPVVDELYSAAPSGFTARRDEIAAAARSEGDKALSAAVRRLRRPTTAAWALNLLCRQEPDLVGQLLELGGLLRQAQSGLDGAALKDLDRQRRGVVGALARRAAALVQEHGHTVDAELTRQVEQSLAAALADPEAGAAVTSGQLTRAVSAVGFGVALDPDAVAVPELVLVGARRRRDGSTGSSRRRSTTPSEGDRGGGPSSGGSRTRSLDEARTRREQGSEERARQERAREERAREARERRAREERERQERQRLRARAQAELRAARAAQVDAERVAEQSASQVAALRTRVDGLEVERDRLRARLAAVGSEAADVADQLGQQQGQQAAADRALLAARRATARAERRAEEADRPSAP